MANVKQDSVQIKLGIDANPAKAELDVLSAKHRLLTGDIKLMRKGTQEYVDANKELKQVAIETAKVRAELGLTGMTYRQLDQYAKQLERQVKIDLVEGTEEFIAKTEELQKVRGRMSDVKGIIDGVDKSLEGAGNGFLNFIKKSAAFTGIQMGIEGAVNGLKQFASDAIDSAAKTSDAIGGIMKTTKMTAEEVWLLNDELKLIDTRTSQEDLQEIARVGGQMGIAKDEILGFTESVDKAVVALGDEFSGGAEQVTKELSSLQKLFKETKELEAGKAINDIGSALNALGADGNATAPVISDFTKRIGQLGNLAPEINETMGLGAAFQELGLTSEIAAGGIGNIMLTAARETGIFSKQLKMTEADFKALVRENPNEVLLRLAESFKGMGADEVAKNLADLKITSQEATKTMIQLAEKTDFVRDKQLLATEAFREGTSLMDEFNTMNETSAAELEKSQNKWAQLKDEVGQGLIPVYIKFVAMSATVVDVLRATPKFIRDNKEALLLLTAALLSFQVGQSRSIALSIYDIAQKQLVELWNKRAALSFENLNKAMASNVFGLVLIGITALIYAFRELEAVSERNQAVQRQTTELNNKLKTAIDQVTEAKALLNDEVTNYNTLSKEEQEKLREKIKLQKESALATLSQIEADRKALVMKAAEINIYDKIKAGLLGAGDIYRATSILVENQSKRMGDAHDSFSSEIERLKKEIQGYDNYTKDINKSQEEETKRTEEYKSEVEKKEADKRQRERERAAEKERQRIEKEKQEQLTASRKIYDLENALLTDEFDRKISQLRTNAEREIAEAKGRDGQIAEQRRLIEEKLSRDIEEIEKQRTAVQLKLAQERTDKELEIRRRALLARAELAVIQAEEQIKNEMLTKGLFQRSELQIQAEQRLMRAKEVLLNQQQQLELEELDNTHNKKLAADLENLKLTGEERKNYELEAEATLLEEKELLHAQYQQRKDDLHRQTVEAQREREKQANMEALQTIQTLTQHLFDFKRIETDKEMAQVEKEKEQQLQSLEAKSKAEQKNGKLSKEQKEKYEKEKSAIETNYDEKARALKKKAAEDEKSANIANAIMAGFLAVIKAAPNIPLQVATGALAALSVAKIAATPIPAFAKGGVIGNALRTVKRKFANGGSINPVAGVPDVGQLHSGGGIQMIDGATGQHLGEWERGEPYMILSRNTYANNKGIIDSLLDSSLYKNGAPIMKKGGIYAESGAVVGSAPAAGSAGSSGGDGYAELVNEVRAVREEIANLPRTTRSYVVYADIEEAAAEVDAVRADAAS